MIKSGDIFCKELQHEGLSVDGGIFSFNFFITEVPIIQKLVHWFVLHKTSHLKGKLVRGFDYIIRGIVNSCERILAQFLTSYWVWEQSNDRVVFLGKLCKIFFENRKMEIVLILKIYIIGREYNFSEKSWRVSKWHDFTIIKLTRWNVLHHDHQFGWRNQFKGE